MRVFLSFLAVWSLGISLLFGVFDIARSIAQAHVTTLSFLQSWQDNLPEYLAAFSGFIKSTFGFGFWEQWLVPVLNLPAWLLFLALSIVFFAAGNLGRKAAKS